ncbi:MAG: CPBP family intramembrane metalloprotease [Candidatus Micrarchaeota archaeon]|nr:CPBP family intramembrane metalloprotease [Candidatus Micrarchaeota archaeon]MDE1848371.1 CPBP family intramembrane metalloprotease [Candidatus Micrarchaeota archaeon]MDE1864808.1 CPBP family intramembrane metalloprotease [Candidatus Micrarchaeota archaeon]
MKIRLIDLPFFLLPLLLWPISFVLLRPIFIYAMFVSGLILAVLSIARYGKYIYWKGRQSVLATIAIGACAALLLYTLFLAGYYVSPLIGIKTSVLNVYSMIYSQQSNYVLLPLLAFIGIFEEVYWRGALQGFAGKKTKLFAKFPWAASIIYYSCVHLLTGNPVLALAAFIVGITTSLVANRYGILCSMITHIVWIEAIIVFLPVSSII